MKKYLVLSLTILISANLFAQTAPVYTSLAVGSNTSATGINAFATGSGVQAVGQNSFAAGSSAKANSINSIALGRNAAANGENAIALGLGAIANTNSVAIGSALANSNYCFAIGTNSSALGNYSFTIGNSIDASGTRSTAMGNYVTTNFKTGSFIIGDGIPGQTQKGNDADNQMMMRFANGYKFFTTESSAPFVINPNGTVGIDGSNQNNGSISPGLIFGNASGEGIASRRTGGGNQYGLDFYSNFISRLSITNGGNIGIGTQAPAAKFSLSATGEDLAGTACSRVFKTYSGVLPANAGAELKLASFGFRSGNWSSLGITAYRFNGADGWQNAAILFGYDVDNSPGAGSFFALAGNGNFGIGTASPGAKLHVMGNIVASGTITPSDIRYKKDIVLISDALKKINQLSGFYYSLKTDEFPEMQFDKRQQVGLVAQDVEKVLPQAVYTVNDYKAVNYSGIIPLLVQGMKEQQLIIEKQQQQIDELKRIVESLLKR